VPVVSLRFDCSHRSPRVCSARDDGTEPPAHQCEALTNRVGLS
jgi:hypothetical protein